MIPSVFEIFSVEISSAEISVAVDVGSVEAPIESVLEKLIVEVASAGQSVAVDMG